MRDIYIKSKAGLLPIGRRGENLATRVTYPGVPEEGQAVTVFVKRNGDSVAYPASEVEVTDTEVIWTVTSVDTDKQGRGQVQYRYSNSETGEVIKTDIYAFIVGLAIDTEVGPAPDPYETWLDSLTELAGQTQVDARVAEASATSAQASAESAESAARQAWVSADSASESQTAAERAAEDAESEAEQAATYSGQAQGYAQQATASATSAAESAGTATTKASEASASATTATTKANEASASAEAAAQSAAVSGYMWFWVGEDGHLYMDRTSNVEVDFVLSETDGHLYATA